jgi:hypothetical protein
MKKIVITEEEKQQIKNLYGLNEQPDSVMDRRTGIESRNKKALDDAEKEFNEYKSKYTCVPDNFVVAVGRLRKNNYNPFFLKAALGIIGRETSFGQGTRYATYGAAKNLYNKLGGDTSGGLSQMKPSTAASVGVEASELERPLGALKASYLLLIKLYDKAREIGYTVTPNNLKDGTGNAALDLAILAYNQGESYIKKYCETENPKYKGQCDKKINDIPGVGKVKILQNKPIQNYIPNYKTDEIHTSKLSSHGYIKEVANYMKKYNCF